MNELKALDNVLKTSQKILLVTHMLPDGDAVGSTIFMCLVLKQLGIDSDLLYFNLNQDDFSFLSFWKYLPIISEGELNLEAYQALFVLDCSNPKRLGSKGEEIINQSKLVVNIDHHGDNSNFGDINIVKSDKAAVGELLYEISQYFNWEITRDMALSLSLSIVTDTGRFQNVNTTEESFRVQKELLSYLSMDDYHDLVRNLYDEVSLDKKQTMSEIISNSEWLAEGVLFSYSERNTDLMDGLVDVLKSTKNVKVAILARSSLGQFKLSFRCKNKDLNIRPLAEKFGGGGHPCASGASVPLVDYLLQLQEAKKIISDYFNK